MIRVTACQVLLVVGLLVAAGCGDPPKPAPPKPGADKDKIDLGKADGDKPKAGGDKPGPGKGPDFKTTAEALAKEAIANLEAAKTKYTDKVVELEAVVSMANTCIDHKAIFLKGAKKDPTDVVEVEVRCLPAAADKDKIWWLGKGQKMKVAGRVSGMNAFIVIMEHCTFTELAASPTPKATATQLTAEFGKDGVAANKKYITTGGKSREVILEGEVAALESKEDNHVVKLTDEGGWAVACAVKKETLSSLKKGDKVTIKGELSDFSTDDKIVNVVMGFVLKKG